MDFDFEDILNEPGFWILGGGGVAMELLGWIIAQKSGMGGFPIWQMLILIVGTLIAAAFFATRE
jgi:hypothetical protein